jgi:hypothetical protein
MSGYPLSTILRAAADAEKIAEAAAEYLAHPPPDDYGISLEWSWGRSHQDAYYAIRNCVRAAIDAQIRYLIRDAVEELQADALAKGRAAREALEVKR